MLLPNRIMKFALATIFHFSVKLIEISIDTDSSFERFPSFVMEVFDSFSLLQTPFHATRS